MARIDIAEFTKSLTNASPPTVSECLIALWYDGKGDWSRAHEIAQDISTPDGSWIHAFLHRKEGDEWNANYWYQRAGRTMPNQSLEDEWTSLVTFFLG